MKKTPEGADETTLLSNRCSEVEKVLEVNGKLRMTPGQLVLASLPEGPADQFLSPSLLDGAARYVKAEDLTPKHFLKRVDGEWELVRTIKVLSGKFSVYNIQCGPQQELHSRGICPPRQELHGLIPHALYLVLRDLLPPLGRYRGFRFLGGNDSV